MSGIALTDHGAMFGIKEFYDYVEKKNAPLISERKALKKEIQSLEAQQARSAEEEARLTELRSQLVEAEAKPLFKPILGCEVYCARRSRFSKEANVPNPYRPTQSIDNSGWHLVLLAKNLTGYKNLIKMVSRAWIDGYYYRPRIDKELLEQYHEGIIASSACLGGEIPQHIMYGNIDEAERSIEWFKGIFGEDFYLELQRHKTDNPLGNQETYEKQQQVNAILLELGRKHGVKVIATNDIHFLNEEDAEAHDRLICLSTGKDLNDPARMRYSKQEWMKTTAEMNELFADVPEALAATEEICAKVEHYRHRPRPSDARLPDPRGVRLGRRLSPSPHLRGGSAQVRRGGTDRCRTGAYRLRALDDCEYGVPWLLPHRAGLHRRRSLYGGLRRSGTWLGGRLSSRLLPQYHGY